MKKESKKRINKEKAIARERDRLLLDTSFQIEKLKSRDHKKHCTQFVGSNPMYSSYFVLYEFKVGFIKSLIDLYYRAKLLNNINRVFSDWSDKWGRTPKFGLVLLSAMAEIYGDIDISDKKRFLNRIEFTIRWMLVNFSTDLKGMVGDFGGDPIVSHSIYDRDDFATFCDAYNNRKQIPLIDFWEGYADELGRFVSDSDIEKKFPKIHKHLDKIAVDINHSMNHYANLAIGDAVISCDAPQNMIITSLDESFEYFCKAIGKKNALVPKIK